MSQLNVQPTQLDSKDFGCKPKNLASKKLKSPLRYPGGKTRAVKHILPFIPEDIQRLCSPFLGGGSVELACIEQRGTHVVGYDAFEPLVCFWQMLLEDSTQLAELVRHYYDERMTSTKFYALQRQILKQEDRLRMAALFFTLNRCSYSGTTLSGGMSPGHPRFTTSIIDRLEQFSAPQLQVQHADFSQSIPQHTEDFLYLDPPYCLNQKLYGSHGDMQVNFDHQALSQLIKNRGQWVLSYNNCEQIRDLYHGHKFKILNWAYGMNSHKRSNEVLILSEDIGKKDTCKTT